MTMFDTYLIKNVPLRFVFGVEEVRHKDNYAVWLNFNISSKCVVECEVLTKFIGYKDLTYCLL